MKNGDKPAFQEVIIEHPNGGNFNEKSFGLTKREYFVAMAMQGLLSSMAEKASYGTWDSEHKEVAKVAVKFADELLKVLEP